MHRLITEDKSYGRLKRLARLAGVLLALTGAGCATTKTTHLYPGPARPQGEVARLVCEGEAGQLTVLTDVDGRPVGSSPISGEHVVCVLPGDHVVSFYWKCYDSVHAGTLSFRDTEGRLVFTAQAGQLYTLRAQDRLHRVHFWIEDQKGREVSMRKAADPSN